MHPTASRQEYKALAALARTCKTLQGPALDVLWHTQDTLAPTFACMPAGVFGMSATGGMTLLRPFTASDWDRPRFYASRVKRLSVGRTDPKEESLYKLFPAMAACLPAPLYPNLTRLTWHHPSTDTDLAFMQMFLAPNITTIWMSNGLGSINLSIVPLLARACPRLKIMSIFLKPFSLAAEPSECDPFVCELLRGSWSIESLTTDAILSVAALQHLGGLKNFTSMNLDTLPRIPLRLTSTNPPLFRWLRTIDVGGVEIDSVTAFFRMCSMAPLERLDITFASCPTAAEKANFYSALAAGCSHASLTDLTLKTPDAHSFDVRQATEAYAPTGAALRSLCAFVNLRWVRIATPLGFDIDDDALELMARSWTRLESLRFQAFLRPLFQRLTLRSLHALAQYCPRLRVLQLTFDASTIPSSLDESVQQDTLNMVFIEYATLSAAKPVARFISRIFPGLTKISKFNLGNCQWENDNDADWPLWRQVMIGLQAIKKKATLANQ
ncbi:hypothetical protein FB451DRAFT_1400437 [Mycena latifolia]|nr:hypothetical protein FB451DRAFT_1400437 [Mycena latifolia]